MRLRIYGKTDGSLREKALLSFCVTHLLKRSSFGYRRYAPLLRDAQQTALPRAGEDVHTGGLFSI